jgi:hypothetical protein
VSSAPSVSRSYAETPAWCMECTSAPPAGAVAIPLRNHGRCPGRRDRSVPRWVPPPRTASSPTSTRNETAIQLVSGCPCGHATNHRNGLRTAASARTPQPRDLTDDCGRIGSESNTAAPSDRDGMGERYAGLDIDRSPGVLPVNLHSERRGSTAETPGSEDARVCRAARQ